MSAVAPVREVAQSKEFHGVARAGLATRATLYLLIAWLAVLVARGTPGKEADQRGALQEITRHTGGTVLLWIIIAGLVGYSLWRFSEAAFGVRSEPGKKAPRVQSFVRGCAYAVLAVNAINLVLTSAYKSQSREQQLLTARVMRHDAGRWLVAIVGIAVVVVGLALVYEGVARKFEKHLDQTSMSSTQRRVVVALGVVGTSARGIVFALAGVFVVRAAWEFDPSKARGVDGALRSLAHTAAGPWLLIAAAVGLAVFGCYGWAEAIWRRT